MQGGGYLLRDHRASQGALEEYDTEQCPHCEKVFVIRKTTIHEEAFCMNCAHRVCPNTTCATTCTPFLRVFDAQLAKAWTQRNPIYDRVLRGGEP
jgi:hypothetical protein